MDARRKAGKAPVDMLLRHFSQAWWSPCPLHKANFSHAQARLALPVLPSLAISCYSLMLRLASGHGGFHFGIEPMSYPGFFLRIRWACPHA